MRYFSLISMLDIFNDDFLYSMHLHYYISLFLFHLSTPISSFLPTTSFFHYGSWAEILFSQLLTFQNLNNSKHNPCKCKEDNKICLEEDNRCLVDNHKCKWVVNKVDTYNNHKCSHKLVMFNKVDKDTNKWGNKDNHNNLIIISLSLWVACSKEGVIDEIK